MDMMTYAMAKAYSDSKGGYTETEKKVIVPEGVFHETGAGYTLEGFIPVAGETYTIVVNGEVYKRKATAAVMGGFDCIYFGDAIAVGGDSTGENWAVAYFPIYDLCSFDWCDGRAKDDTTIAIYQETETVHPIDPKYLPGVCLPMVEITSTIIPNEEVFLTENEAVQLDEVATLGLPVILRFYIGDTFLSICTTNFNNQSFQFVVGGMSINAYNFTRTDENGVLVEKGWSLYVGYEE